MSDELPVRSLTLVCDVSGGRRRPCGKPLAIISVIDGELRALGGSVLPVTHSPSGAEWILVPCPKHGPRQVGREEIVVAWEEGRRVLPVSRRGPAGIRSR